VLITIDGAGHQWPGSAPIRDGADPPSQALNATSTPLAVLREPSFAVVIGTASRVQPRIRQFRQALKAEGSGMDPCVVDAGSAGAGGSKYPGGGGPVNG